MRIGGKEYPTVSQAAERFGVNVKTVKAWIDKGIIPEPPTIDYGVRNVRVFPDDYMRKALQMLKKARNPILDRQTKPTVQNERPLDEAEASEILKRHFATVSAQEFRERASRASDGDIIPPR